MEHWKAVRGYEGLYEVSDQGGIRSLDRTVRNGHGLATKRGKPLHISSDKDGYGQVGLCAGGVGKTKKVHRLVAEAFIENPENLPEVNHKDFGKANNAASNLEWCSRKHNQGHASMNGRFRSEAMGQSKLTRDQVVDIRERVGRGEKMKEVSIAFSVHIETIRKIISRETWKR